MSGTMIQTWMIEEDAARWRVRLLSLVEAEATMQQARVRADATDATSTLPEPSAPPPPTRVDSPELRRLRGLDKGALLTTEETALYLGVCTRTIYRLLNDNEIPATRIGHAWKYRKGELDAWLAAGGTLPQGGTP